jgi:hypothetical protein
VNTFVTSPASREHLRDSRYRISREMVEADHAIAYTENLRRDGRCEVCEEATMFNAPHAPECPVDGDEVRAIEDGARWVLSVEPHDALPVDGMSGPVYTVTYRDLRAAAARVLALRCAKDLDRATSR